MLCLIHGWPYPYRLFKTTHGLVLRKDAFQASLFGGEAAPVAPTRKAKQRAKQQAQWGEQGSLFNLGNFQKPKALKPKTPKAPKAPKMLRPKAETATGPKVGDRQTRADGSQWVFADTRRWRKVKGSSQKATPSAMQAKPETPDLKPKVGISLDDSDSSTQSDADLLAELGVDEPDNEAIAQPLPYSNQNIYSAIVRAIARGESPSYRTRSRITPLVGGESPNFKLTDDGRIQVREGSKWSTVPTGVELHDLATQVGAKGPMSWMDEPDIEGDAEPIDIEADPDAGNVEERDGRYSITDYRMNQIRGLLDGIPVLVSQVPNSDSDENFGFFYLESDDIGVLNQAFKKLSRAGFEIDPDWNEARKTGFVENVGMLNTVPPGPVVAPKMEPVEAEPDEGAIAAPPIEEQTETPTEVSPQTEVKTEHLTDDPERAAVMQEMAVNESVIEPDAAPPLGLDADYKAVRGQRKRKSVNKDVKSLLNRGGPYSEDEQVLLSGYSGKGGLKDDEASLSEYYTRADVAQFAVSILDQIGGVSGTVLEPSCGSGVFLNAFRDRPDILPVGVEIDETSAGVAAALNPHADVSPVRLERFLLDNPNFTADHIVGNVPFGTRTVDSDIEASRYKLSKWRDNADLFVNECAERLKPGGSMSLILPHGVMSGKSHQRLREELVKHGRVIGGYRLPSDTFEHSGTQVVTDVLVFQKHPDDIATAIANGDQDIINATADHSFVGGAYFDDNPQHVLGNVEFFMRGDRPSMTVKGNIDEAIATAEALQPAVTYDGLPRGMNDDLAAKEGDRKVIGGRTYELRGGRWHRVDEEPDALTDVSPDVYGVDSLEAAHAVLDDIGQRVKIDPDQLESYINLAKGHLHGLDIAMMRDALNALDSATSPSEREKLARAMLLAGHLKLLQRDDASAEDLELALGMLQSYREDYGNPATDKKLHGLTLKHPSLLALMGGFDETGNISDHFANPEMIHRPGDRSQSTVVGAMEEAFRSRGAEPVIIDDISEYLAADMDDSDIAAALLAEPTVGFIDGAYMPMNHLMNGNGYELMERMEEIKALHEDDSPIARKMTGQIEEVLSKLDARSLEDMSVHFWSVGSWIPDEALNDFFRDRDLGMKLTRLEDGRVAVRGGGKIASGVERAMNQEKIRGNETASYNYLMKDALRDLEGEFKSWLGSSEHRFDVEDNYNRAFSGDLLGEFSDAPLEIAGFDQNDGDPENGVRAKRLHGYQTSTIRQMAESGRGINALGVGLGKAQPLTAKVLTPSGWKLMGDIQVGDKVINSQGTSSTVTGVFPQGEKDIYEVVFKDGSSTESCKEHLWSVWESHDLARGKCLRTLPLEEIVNKGVLRKVSAHFASKWAIPNVKPIEFSEQDLPVDPYLLGVLIGDGSIGGKQVRFSTADMDIVGEVVKAMPEGLNIYQESEYDYRISTVKPGEKQNRHVVNPLTKALREICVMGCRAHEKFIPDIYKFAPVRDRIALLQGLLDTDGSTWKAKRGATTVEFCSASEQLARDVEFIVQSLGGMAVFSSSDTSYTYKGEKKQGRTRYRLRIKLHSEIKPFRLSRKAKAYVAPSKYPPVRFLKEVNFVGRKPAQCIMVDAPDHLYVTDDCILTHNTATSIGLALYLKQKGQAKKVGIVTPKSVLANWMKEIKFWSPDANIAIIGMTQQFWGDGSDAYEIPGFQVAMEGEKQQFLSDGSPIMKLKNFEIATTGSGRKRQYKRDKQGNYLIYSDEDSDGKKELIPISEEDLTGRASFVYSSGSKLPVKDGDGNYTLYADGDRARAYPIVVSESDLKKRGSLVFSTDDAATKQKKMAQVAQNSYDMVLMSQPVYQQIGISPDRHLEYLEQIVGQHLNPDTKDTNVELEKIRASIDPDESSKEGDRHTIDGRTYELKGGRWHRIDGGALESLSVQDYKQLQQEEKLKTRLLSRDFEKQGNIYWEDLGIDCIMADEAHAYKNLFAPFREGNDVAFLSTATSKRSLDHYFKNQYTRETNNNQNTYMLTATPTTNNPLEAYNMLMHVCPDELESRGINNIDSFLSHFGSIEEVQTIGVDLQPTNKNGLVGFENLKDLRKLFKKYCRMQQADEVGLDIPKEDSQDVYVDMSPAQQGVYDSLRERAQEMMELMKDPNHQHSEGDDHIFSIISDMDKAAIDLDYYSSARSDYGVDPVIESDEDRRSPKIDAAIQRVMGSRAKNSGKQLIFCDAVQLHEPLKQRLIEAGYPEDQIVICNASTAKSAQARQKLSQQYNSGQKSIVIGNTATMGEGMNLQIGTTDIHHLTMPWTPAAIEQRNGRGVRQGNEVDSVGVHYYHANASFDGYRKTTNDRKAGWIGELWDGKEDTAQNQNVGLGGDDLLHLFSDDPEKARAEMEANKELQNAKVAATMKGKATKKFKQLQNQLGLWANMDDAARNSPKGQKIKQDIAQGRRSLQNDNHFDHKALLASDTPAYVHKDGSIIAVGHHVKGEKDGSVYRVTGVNLKSQKLSLVNVAGPDHSPGQSRPDYSLDVKTAGVGRSYSPVEYNDEIHVQRVVKSSSSYRDIQKLSPEQVDLNRDQLKTSLRESYSNIAHILEDGSVGIETGRRLPPDARIILPHDGEGQDALLRAIAKEPRNWRLGSAYSDITGKSTSDPDVVAKIQSIQNEGLTEGTTRTNAAGHTETFRDGRWHVDRPAAAPETKSVASTVEPAASASTGVAPTTKEPESVVSTAAPAGEPHPDPVGAVNRALLHMQENNTDYASERNDAGFNQFDTKFGADLAAKLEAGGTLTTGQRSAALNMLRKYQKTQLGHIPLPTDQQLEHAHANVRTSKPGVNLELKQTVHAKKGIDLYVAVIPEKIAYESYQAIKREAKNMGGYYSRYAQRGAIPGFQFEDRETAERFIYEHGQNLQKSASTRILLGDVAYEFLASNGVPVLCRVKHAISQV